jgi:hypothetical protein
MSNSTDEWQQSRSPVPRGFCEIVKFVGLNPRARPGESLRVRNLRATVAFHPLFRGLEGPGARDP